MSELAIFSLVFHYQKYLSTRWNNSETFLTIYVEFFVQKFQSPRAEVPTASYRKWRQKLEEIDRRATLKMSRRCVNERPLVSLCVSVSLFPSMCVSVLCVIDSLHWLVPTQSLSLPLSLCVLVCGLDLGSTATWRLHSHWTDRKSNTAKAKQILRPSPPDHYKHNIVFPQKNAVLSSISLFALRSTGMIQPLRRTQ